MTDKARNVRVHSSLSLECATQIIDRAIAIRIREGMRPLAVAVLDAGAQLVAYKRENGSGVMRFDIAFGKAHAALGMGASTRHIRDRLSARPAFAGALAAASGGRFIPAPGGVLILDADEVAIGAVGVSGDVSDKDEYCAIQAVLDAGLNPEPTEPAAGWRTADLRWKVMNAENGISLRRNGAILEVTLVRPGNGNRLSNAAALEIAAALNIGADAHLVLLRAQGNDFCMGRDLAPQKPGATALDVRASNTDPILALVDALRRAPMPVLAVVRGQCIGFGCALAALCDITLAADNTTFVLPEMAHGIPPLLALSSLADRVPLKVALHMAYSRAPMDAQAALRNGLVSRVVAEPELDEAAQALAQAISGYKLGAVRAVKDFLRHAPRQDPAAASSLAGNLLTNVISSST
jgi:enoyl-CoA hydratase/carnithine racemase/uncharacterized protein GlcG (DUF336 family)